MLETNMGMGVAPIALSLFTVIFFLIVWFFLSRASVRANEQIRLLQEIVEQQKQQTEVLKALLANATGVSDGQNDSDIVSSIDFKGFIPER
ncbi:YebO family protein [Yersinia aleksiciae]|uniref:YebO family protein n=1 Tax=Yersinia aleksiciae TaxID=263819 RepID=UPI0011A91BB6|nr:YebO family protein [Yersinia aleksiciae]MDN0124372.1 YebO family protein [Yersinia aleksiciae]